MMQQENQTQTIDTAQNLQFTHLNRILACCFPVIIGVLCLLYFVLPQKSFSAVENRNLAMFPELKWSTIFLTEQQKAAGTKTFMLAFEEYASDQVAFRDQWVTAMNLSNRGLMRTQFEDVFVTADGSLLTNTTMPGESFYNNLGYIANASDKLNIPVYLALTPNSTTIYPEKLPKFAMVLDEQTAFMADLGQQLSANTGYINLYPAMMAHKDEYIYFQTDHHWTALGAYYGYAEIAENLGITPLPLDAFDRTVVADDFYGTYYAKAVGLPLPHDSIERYTPKGDYAFSVTIDDGKPQTYNSLYFDSRLETWDKYTYFLDGNHGKVTITRQGGSTGKKLLMIKDSYSHVLAPYLACHYDEIVMLDLRYYRVFGLQGLQAMIDQEGYDQLLFCFSAKGLNDGQLRSLAG